MTILGPLLALAGVIVGAGLSYLATTLGEHHRERWALGREWRERKLQAYGRYVADIKRMRDLAQRIAAHVGLDDQAFPPPREQGIDQLAEANMVRSSSYETVVLLGAPPVVEAARELNRAIWRLDWFARGLLNDADTQGWLDGLRGYHRAVDVFHHQARLDMGVGGAVAPRTTEPPLRDQYARESAATVGPKSEGESPSHPTDSV